MDKSNTKSGAFLSLDHLVKVYQNNEKAVYDFNLDIKRNEFIVIVGPSGCGKSTTLRMIAGLEDITSGEIYLNGELLNYKPSSERRMAIVFQSYALYPQMTVYNNIAFPLTIKKYPFPAIDESLLAVSEIKKICESVAFNKIAGVMYNLSREKRKRNDRIENVATIFNVSYEAGKLLTEIFKPYSKCTHEELVSKENEIRELMRQTTDEHTQIAEQKNKEEGITLDGDFCRVDENGVKKYVYRKYTSFEIKTRVYETAEKLDLIPYLDKLPKELSGGQMQRVALGRAIVKNVPIFLMDEPLSNLDAKLRLTMRSEIVKLHNRIGATTIYVTHDQTEAMTMATRIVVMSRGFVQQIGTPEEIYDAPANIFVAKFIGSPAMNFFDMRFDRHKARLICGEFSIAVDETFIAKHDGVYLHEREKYRKMLENFDEAACDEIRKTLSATGELGLQRNVKPKKENVFVRLSSLIKKLVKKFKKAEESRCEELEICSRKLKELEKCLTEEHTVSVGIRPERIKIELKKDYKGRNGFTVKPTMCELVGGEYNVHFDFCGKDMVGRIDAKYKITPEDELAVSFSMSDAYVFDPITGSSIR